MTTWQIAWVIIFSLCAVAIIATALMMGLILIGQRRMVKLKKAEIAVIKDYLEITKGYAHSVVAAAPVTQQVVAEEAQKVIQAVEKKAEEVKSILPAAHPDGGNGEGG